jgi:hypothetical protein
VTTILYDGSEKGSHRVLLEGMGVKNFAMSYWRLKARGLPKTKPYRIEEYFQEDANVYVDSGWIQAEKNLTEEELHEYAVEYEEFLANNLSRIAGATELHLKSLGMPWIEENRHAYSEEMGTLIWPVWTPDDGQMALFSLAERYDNVALPNSAIEGDPVIPTRINALTRQHQTAFHALNTAKPDTLKSLPLETASTISWASPQMRGETIVWDGGRLVRYPKKMKDQARSRYKAVVERAGLDYSKVVDDDPTEVTRLAIWSYLQLESSMDKDRPTFTVIPGGASDTPKSVTDSENRDVAGNPEREGSYVAHKDLEVRKSNLPTVARESHEKAILPVMGVNYKTVVENVNGQDVIREIPVLESRDASLRVCNTCILANTCPAFKPDTACAFSLPVEVKTKEQLKSLLNTVMEMQGQRVAFARFAEEMNGGYPDPNLSTEMDRLFKMVKTMKDLESNNEFVRLTVERQQSGGVLSALFGERAEVLTQLPATVEADSVIQQIIDPQ